LESSKNLLLRQWRPPKKNIINVKNGDV
jgi:hypothetical protein